MFFLKSKLFHCAVFASLVYTPWAFSVGSCEDTFSPVLIRQIEYSDFSPNLKFALKSNNLSRIGDVARLTEKQLLDMSGIGQKALDQIKRVLSEDGLHLGMEMKNWPPREEKMNGLENKLALMEIEKRAQPDEAKILKELWLAIDRRFFDVPRIPEKMMKALRAKRDDLNNLKALKEELAELEALRVRKLDDLSPEELRRNMDDLDVLKEQMDKLQNLKEMGARISEVEWLQKNLSVETNKVEKLDPIFVESTRLLSVDAYDRYFYPAIEKLLRSYGIIYIGGLITRTAEELFEILGFSFKFLHYVRYNLSIEGLRLNTKIEGWPPSREKTEELIKRNR